MYISNVFRGLKEVLIMAVIAYANCICAVSVEVVNAQTLDVSLVNMNIHTFFIRLFV